VIPSLLERYLLARLARASALMLALLCLLYLSVDLGDQGRRLALTIGWQRVLHAALLRLPLIAAQLLPAALLLGGALAIGRLQRQQELQALRSLGFSTLRLARCLLLLGLVATGVMLLLLEALAPPCEAKADELRLYRRPSPLLGPLSQGRWRREPTGWYHRDGTTTLSVLLHDARVMERHEGALGDQPPRSLRFTDDGIEPLSSSAPKVSLKPPRRFLPHKSAPRPEALSSWQLEGRIHALAMFGGSDRVERLVLHLRHTYPLLALVAALLLFGQLQRPPRSQSKQLTWALLWTALFWVLVAGSFSAGRSGIIAPSVAAWLPIALATFASAAWLVCRKRSTRS